MHAAMTNLNEATKPAGMNLPDLKNLTPISPQRTAETAAKSKQ